jgi:hypothetical protein
VRRPLLAAAAAAALLSVASGAFGARGFSDRGGDENSAPDITSVEISESAPGTMSVKLAVANYTALPEESWVNLWFDIDSSSSTGDDAGDEQLVRYLSSGAIEVYRWSGSQYVPGSNAGIAASFVSGTLTVTLPRDSVNAGGPFGVLAVASRGQLIGDEELVASDFAPDSGRSAFTGPSAATFPDAMGDQDAAPDLTAVRVSDAKSGWITFAITTPNYSALPPETALAVIIDVDNNRRTGDGGADLTIEVGGGEIAIERWARSGWQPDDLPTRARVRQGRNAVSIDVHVSELDNTRAFGFALASLDVNTAEQQLVGADFAPDSGTYWRYPLVNKPALKLTATLLSATPARPTAGKRFAVNLAVTRSDTRRPISSGSVGCRVLAAGKPVAAKGSVAGGAGHCSLLVPATAAGKRLRGTITVRSGGKVVSADFAYVIR